MTARRATAAALGIGAALLILSVAKAQVDGEGRPAGGQTAQQPVIRDQPEAVRPGGAEPDINNGRFVAVGGATQDIANACFRCHGLQGAGDSAGAFPRLADQSAWYLFKALQDYASGRRNNAIMTPIAQALTTEQMEDVAAYYASVKDAPYPPSPEVDPLMLQQGAALSAVGSAEQGVQACVNCHGPEGVGMPPVYPYLAGQHAPYLELQLRLWKEDRRGADPLNVMKTIADQLTDEQVRAVSLYFASIRVPEVTPEGAFEAGGATATTPEEGAPSGTALGVTPDATAGSGTATDE